MSTWLVYIENSLTEINCEIWPRIWLAVKFNFVLLFQNINSLAHSTFIKNCNLKIQKKKKTQKLLKHTDTTSRFI